MVLVLLNIVLVYLAFWENEDDRTPPVPRAGTNVSGQVTPTKGTAKPSKAPSHVASPTAPAEPDIQLATSTLFGQPFETVRVDGTYVPMNAPIQLRVQWQRRDDWVNFPLPVMPKRSGDFTAYVEFGRTGRYQLRILEPTTGATSGVAVLYVR